MKFLQYFLILPFFLCASVACAADFDTDFENGLSQWSIEQPLGYAKGVVQVQDAIVKEGKQSLRLAATEKDSIARITSAHIPLTENRNIAFKGWYRFSGEESVMEIRFRSVDANGTIMEPWQDYFQFHRLEPAKDWTQFSIPLAIHAAAHSIDITITYSGGAGEAYFDNLEIQSLTAASTPTVGYMLDGIGSQQARFSVESPLKKIYHDSKPPQAIGKELHLSVAKGEAESVQLILWTDIALKNLKVRFENLQGAGVLQSGVLQAHYVGEVNVKQPDSLGRSGDVPDPLFTKPPSQINKDKPQSIWITVRAPRDAVAGIYTGKVVISADELQAVTIPLNLRIYNFALPEKPSLTTLARIWNFPVEGESGPPETRKYFRSNLKDYRISGEQTVADLPIQVSADGQVAIDWKAWDASAAEYFSKYYENFLYKIDLDTTPFLLRAYPWTLYRQKITGLEWWAVTYWETDPYKNTRQGKLTNGNGFLIYPDHETKTFPINSIRWDAYRDGLEDHDYLSLLAKTWDEALQRERITDEKMTGNVVANRLASQLFQSDFLPILDIKKMMDTRQYIAETIEQLEQNPHKIRELSANFRK